MSIDVSSAHTVEVGYDEFCGALAAHDLQALWSLQRKIMPDVPIPSTRPWLWKWDTVFPLARRAGEIITIERGGDRRVLALANPGLNGLPFTIIGELKTKTQVANYNTPDNECIFIPLSSAAALKDIKYPWRE